MSKKVPLRMCVGCRQMKEKKELVRILKQEDQTFCVDLTGKKNGRGAYLCKDMECFRQAMNNHGLERSFRMQIPEDVRQKLKEEMEQLES